MPENLNKFSIGIGVVIERNGKILVGKRLGSFGAGTWSIPGGWLEHGETIEQAAAREVLEETGLVVKELKTLTTFIDDTEGRKDVAIVILVAKNFEGEPQRIEPHKNAGWEWHDPKAIPKPWFGPMAQGFEKISYLF